MFTSFPSILPNDPQMFFSCISIKILFRVERSVQLNYEFDKKFYGNDNDIMLLYYYILYLQSDDDLSMKSTSVVNNIIFKYSRLRLLIYFLFVVMFKVLNSCFE